MIFILGLNFLFNLVRSIEIEEIYNGIELRYGKSNILIHVPHGGWVEEARMHERPQAGCYDTVHKECVYHYICRNMDKSRCEVALDSDFRTYHFADVLSNELRLLTGASPYFIASKIPRTFVDVSAGVGKGTFGYANNTQFYMEYTNNLNEIIGVIKHLYGTGILLEITHHNYDAKLTILGYGITDEEIAKMEKGSMVLSSITAIMKRGENSHEPWEYITGNLSLGHFLTINGIENVTPSPRFKQTYPLKAQYTSNTIERFRRTNQKMSAILISLSHVAPISNATIHQFALSIKEFLENGVSFSSNFGIPYLMLLTIITFFLEFSN